MSQVLKRGAGNETVCEVDATLNAEVITLPSNFATGRKFTVRRLDSGTSGHAVTIGVTTGQYLDTVLNGTLAVSPNTEGWLSPANPGIWESFGLVPDTTAMGALFGPAIGSNEWLKTWAANIDSLIQGTTITRSGTDAATGANVIWPNGTAGAYAGTESTGTPGAIDSYTVTYVGATTKTVTQPALTRSATGAVTNRPAMTVA